MSNKDKETRPLDVLPIRVVRADDTQQVFDSHEAFTQWLDASVPLEGERVAFGNGAWLNLKEYIASRSGVMSVELYDSLSLDESSVDALSVEPGQVEETLTRSPVFSQEKKKGPPPLPPKLPTELPEGPLRTVRYAEAEDFGMRASDEKSPGIRDTEEHPFPDWAEDPGQTVSDAAPSDMEPEADDHGSPPVLSEAEQTASDFEARPVEPAPASVRVQERPTRAMVDPETPRYPTDAPTLSFESEEPPEIIHEVTAPSGALKGFILGVATTLAGLAVLYLLSLIHI